MITVSCKISLKLNCPFESVVASVTSPLIVTAYLTPAIGKFVSSDTFKNSALPVRAKNLAEKLNVFCGSIYHLPRPNVCKFPSEGFVKIGCHFLIEPCIAPEAKLFVYFMSAVR